MGISPPRALLVLAIFLPSPVYSQYIGFPQLSSQRQQGEGQRNPGPGHRPGQLWSKRSCVAARNAVLTMVL